VGKVEDMTKVGGPGFKEEGNLVVLLGKNKEELGASEYLKCVFHLEKGRPPRINLEEEKRIQEFCIEAISKGILQSAHDVSEGGLAICLAECAFLANQRIGCLLDIPDEIRTDALLFGETQSRIIVTIKRQHLQEFLDLAQEREVEISVLGKTGGRRLIIHHCHQKIIDVDVEQAFYLWKQSIPESFKIK